MIGLAAWGYPRLRAGLRAIVALFFGIFGIVTGIEAGYYTTKGGPTGDDFTGLLAIPAGIVLIGLALRHALALEEDAAAAARGGTSAGRSSPSAGSLVLYFLIVPLSVSYVFTHVARGFVPTPELGTAYEEVSFTTSDGLELEGLVHPVEEPRCRDRVPGPERAAAARPDARPPRLRRAAVRPPR